MQNGEPMTASSYEKMWKGIIKAMSVTEEDRAVILSFEDVKIVIEKDKNLY